MTAPKEFTKQLTKASVRKEAYKTVIPGLRVESKRTLPKTSPGLTESSIIRRSHGPYQPAKVHPLIVHAPPLRPVSTRRLSSIPRDEQRPMEVRLHYMRNVDKKQDEEISSLLDLHIDDLDALALTYGQP